MPAAGQVFTGWTGACTGTGPCDLTLDQDRAVTAGFSAGPSPDPTTPTLVVSGLKAKLKKRVASLTSKVKVNLPGTTTQRATTKKGKKRKTWCKASKAVSKAGTYTLRCKLGKEGREDLRKKALKLTLWMTFKPTGGSAITKNRKSTLKRRR